LACDKVQSGSFIAAMPQMRAHTLRDDSAGKVKEILGNQVKSTQLNSCQLKGLYMAE
jgi:hypothetical protein